MSKKADIYGIVGAGGFGREVMPVARQMIAGLDTSENAELVFVVEGLAEETSINGYRVISDSAFITMEAADRHFNIAIADHQARRRIAEKMIESGVRPFSITAENAVLLDQNQVGEGAILCPFTTITSNVTIGKFFHSNIYAYVGHDCVIGDFVTFAPSVHCNGTIVIEDYAYIGTGAIIKQGSDEKPMTIGKGAVVGMGAVVTKSVPPFTTVIGNPAAELKRK